MVTRVTWSTLPVTDAFIEAVNSRKAQVVSTGDISTVRAWGTVYFNTRLDDSKGWIVQEPGGFLLCFHSPSAQSGPDGDSALVGAASPAEFLYFVKDLPAGAKLRFVEQCELGANNSFKPIPHQGGA